MPLASSGILPLFQGYFCHAIPICSLEPVRSLYDFKISQITNLTFNWVQLFNQPQVADSLTTLAQFGNQIDKQIIQAQKITSSIQLSSTIYMSLDEFEMKLVNILGINSSLNANASTLLVLLTSSNPNFNYLYSNYSQKYIEPDRPVNVSIHKSAFSILYGPDLDVIVLTCLGFNMFKLKRNFQMIFRDLIHSRALILWIAQYGCALKCAITKTRTIY